MNQLTVRGLRDALVQAIRRLANRDETSLNRAAAKLRHRGAGLDDEPRAYTVGSSLDHLIGTWSDAEADEIERALRRFRTIDEAMWK